MTTASVTAPVHKKFVNNTNHSDNNNNNSNHNNNNKFINRFINKSTHCHSNSHYSKSLSLNRHTTSSEGVGCITLSPYSYEGGVSSIGNRGTKSDIGGPSSSVGMRQPPKSLLKNCQTNRNNNLMHKSSSILLPSVHSELSLYDAAFSHHPKIPELRYDILNNNIESPMSALKTASSSKLLYTNKHRFNSNLDNLTATDNNKNVSSYHGPLVYKNGIDGDRMRWNNSVFDNPIMTVSQHKNAL